MTNWEPHAVLANCPLSEAIEAGTAAFVPPEDPRIRAINAEHPNHGEFLRRFTDAFGEQVRPTILLLRMSAPDTYRTVNAIASMRDVLSASVVPLARARRICVEQGLDVCFSTAFEFYPWMIGKDYEDLIMNTPSIRGCHDVEEFNGQRSPEVVPVVDLSRRDLDSLLWQALAERWRKSYAVEPSPDQSLMRSLNMAHHASLLPANQDTRHFDYGRQIALWVSAFEILAHPGSEPVDRWAVCRTLDSAHWTKDENKRKDLPVGKSGKSVTLPSWLYLRLNSVRNDYLHGNPVDSRTLQVPTVRRILADFAAPLYRMALTAFLGLRPKDLASGAEAFEESVARLDGFARQRAA